MTWRALGAAALLLYAGAAAAQFGAEGSDYTALQLDSVENLVADFEGRIERMWGGVAITLVSDDPEVAPLPISGDEIRFDYPEEGGTMPSRIVLEGNAHIEHPQATVTAERADWDFEAGTLVFTGNPVLNSPNIRNLKAKSILLDFENNRFQIEQGRDAVVDTSSSAATMRTADPSLLKEDQIKDWPALSTLLREQCLAEAPSPGRRIMEALGEGNAQRVAVLTVEQLGALKADFVKQLNKALVLPDVYDAAAWEGVALPQEARDLLAAQANAELERRQVTRLNRLLVEAAYPGLIAAAPEPAPKTGAAPDEAEAP